MLIGKVLKIKLRYTMHLEWHPSAKDALHTIKANLPNAFD